VSEGTLKVCFDRILTGRQLLRAEKLAVSENPENQPFGQHAALTARPEHILTPEDIASDVPNEQIAMALLTGTKWANGRVLNVGFMGGTREQRTHVQEHAPLWSQYCSITFRFVTDPRQAEIRIAFNPSAGASSFLGTHNLAIPKNRATMNLGWLEAGTTWHELGHALGLIHEHSSPGADIPWNMQAVYQDYAGPPNYWSREMVNHNVVYRYSSTVTQYSRYDRKSVMHYPILARHLTDSTGAVGWNRALSATDKSYIGFIYPK
jgi:hypothetical protein